MNGNFASGGTVTVALGPCLCPDAPHEQDTAEVYEELPWEVLVEVGSAVGIESYRRLVRGAIASWSLVDDDGEQVPITDEVVRRLRPDRALAIAQVANAAFERANSPLPNGSSAPSAPSRRGSASSTRTTRRRERRSRRS